MVRQCEQLGIFLHPLPALPFYLLVSFRQPNRIDPDHQHNAPLISLMFPHCHLCLSSSAFSSKHCEMPCLALSFWCQNSCRVDLSIGQHHEYAKKCALGSQAQNYGRKNIFKTISLAQQNSALIPFGALSTFRVFQKTLCFMFDTFFSFS